MKRSALISTFVLFLMCQLFSQNRDLELLFTADHNGDHVTLDSILIRNLSMGGDTILYAPDTILSLIAVGIPEAKSAGNTFTLSQNYPNPFFDKTELTLTLNEKDFVDINVFNLLGQTVASFNGELTQGIHRLSFVSGGEKVYLMSVNHAGTFRTIKMFSTATIKQKCGLTYKGNQTTSGQLKSASQMEEFNFNFGDDLLFIGYADTAESGMVHSPLETMTYVFQFATNIPCIGAETVDYEGQTYNTIQVLSQCWFQENLNVGTMIYTPEEQTDNDIIEKYCLSDQLSKCNSYGGVYMWDELMQYSTEEGTRGICPPGWHVPTDEEWKVLEGAVDSYYGIGHSSWDASAERGLDAGTMLKSTYGWHNNGNGTDDFGYTILSGGYYYSGIGWAGGPLFSPLYTSTQKEMGSEKKPCHRGFSWVWSKISRDYDLKEHARPVRCLKNID